MSLTPVSPQTAQQLVSQGALLVDIRPADEYAREHIAGARQCTLELMGELPLSGGRSVVFHCRSGNRTRLSGQALHQALPTGCAGYVLEGGLDAWKAQGLPVKFDAAQPLELQRQVQLGAGSLALLGAVLGATVSPWWHLLSAFVGCGLILAGATGFCGLARVLLLAPWNRKQ
ncbi:rhodanese family protein [Comamonas composti]|uniref:rhodanese family protein n=1 Tax=Comamonas composti TaxID=408558 RepID=UPI000426A2DB|nr:rhodanese family protein [Comamonas composti]